MARTGKCVAFGCVMVCSFAAAGAARADGETAIFPSQLLASPATVDDPFVVLGVPDDDSVGLGEDRFVYSLRTYRMFDGAGPDLTVYEADFGAIEFSLVDILVSLDGLDWVSISGTMTTAVRVAGDEHHGSASHRKSFDLAGSGMSEVRYIKVQGTGKGAASGTNGFDLDAVAVIHGRVPAPATLMAFAGLGAMRRRRR